MATTFENGLTIVRHDSDPLVSVYRGAGAHAQHLGLIYPPIRGKARRTFDASPAATLSDRLANASFATEAEAIAYLAS